MAIKIYASIIKRVLDILASFTGIIVFSPVLVIVTFLLWIDFKSSPFFLQERPGKNQRIFKIIKFKSMKNPVDFNGAILSNRERITKLGGIVRRYSLDEIPQLFNVLKGDMSIIGPRPLVPKYLPYYTKNEQKRHDVRPGVTGLAQVKGRNDLVWEDRFALDVEYVENLNLLLDIKIFYWTVIKVFRRSNIAIDQDEFLDIFDVYRQKQWDGIVPKGAKGGQKVSLHE